MCGRFYDIYELDDITTRFRVDRPRDLSLPFRYNVAPSQSVPVIRVQDDERELTLMRWGLIGHSPRPAQDRGGAARGSARHRAHLPAPAFGRLSRQGAEERSRATGRRVCRPDLPGRGAASPWRA